MLPMKSFIGGLISNLAFEAHHDVSYLPLGTNDCMTYLSCMTEYDTRNVMDKYPQDGTDEDMAKYQRSTSMPSGGSTSASPMTPSTPVTPSTPTSARKENVWRSVFHPGSNMNTKTLGAQIFDKPASSSSPTVYDWLYSGESRSRHF